MIISHKYKFICLDPPKTGTNYRQNLLWNYGEHISGLQHANLIEVKNFFQDQNLEDYFVFTFVRNPWRRYFSWFNFLHSETARDQIPPREFSVFIKTMLNKDHLKISKPQSFWFMDKGSINVDFIGSLENLTQDMSYILNRIGLPIDFSNKIVLQSKYKLNFHDAYNQELIDIVAQKESDVIKLKGYTI